MREPGGADRRRTHSEAGKGNPPHQQGLRPPLGWQMHRLQRCPALGAIGSVERARPHQGRRPNPPVRMTTSSWRAVTLKIQANGKNYVSGPRLGLVGVQQPSPLGVSHRSKGLTSGNDPAPSGPFALARRCLSAAKVVYGLGGSQQVRARQLSTSVDRARCSIILRFETVQS